MAGRCSRAAKLTQTHQIHSKLMQTCAVFATFSGWLSKELEKTDPDLSGATKPPGMTDDQWRVILAGRPQSKPGDSASSSSSSAQDGEARIKSLVELIRKWEHNFSRHLQILLDALNHYAATETVALLSLCARLSTANQGTEYAGLRHEEDVEA